MKCKICKKINDWPINPDRCNKHDMMLKHLFDFHVGEWVDMIEYYFEEV